MKWFFMTDQEVKGPFSKEEIESLFISTPLGLAWGKGFAEWMGPNDWKKSAESVSQQDLAAETQDPLWKLKIRDNIVGPLSYLELIQTIKQQEDVNVLHVWSEADADWKDVFAINRIVEDLGITRREHSRVPIMGKLHIELPKGFHESKVVSISEGGLGIHEAPVLMLGEKFKASFESPHMFATINATCEVVYNGGDGYMGLRFVHLPMEAKSGIIEYVRKFTKEI